MRFLVNNNLWRAWRALIRASLVRDLEFRFNFISGLIRQFFWLASFVVFINVIFHNTDSLAGWSEAEVLVVLALSRFLEGLADTTFARNIANLPEVINQGQFDFYLLKPLPVQLYVGFNRFNYSGLGNVAAGSALLIYASTKQSLGSWETWAIFFLLATLGLIMYYCILMIIVVFAFFAEQFGAYRAITHMISEPFTVPFDIFPPYIRTFITYLIPLAFVVFVPAQTLTGRLAWWQVPVAFGLTGIFLLLANLAWRAGLRRYSSASS